MKNLCPFLTLACVSLIGISQAETKEPQRFKANAVNTVAVMKVVVRADGSVFVDGKPTPVQAVPGKLTAIQKKKGVIWFHRANPQGAPPPNSQAVFQMVLNAQRPFVLFTKEDFSEAIGPDGKPQKMDS